MRTYRLTHPLRRLMPLACAVLMASTLGTRPANAGGVVGTGTPASCTPAAFNAALVGGGLVTFNCGPNPHTITVAVANSILINTTIRGGGRITLTAVGGNNFFVVPAGSTLVLERIRLTGGIAIDGGAIENFGTTRVTGVTFDHNNCSRRGGAIANHQRLTVERSTFSQNNAFKGGGAIWSYRGAVNVSDSRFNTNQATDNNGIGGAIGNGSGKLTVARSTFRRNVALGTGGAIYNNATTGVTLSVFTGNNALRAGGAIHSTGLLLLVDRSTLDGNKADVGGGIAYQAGPGNLLFVNASTLSRNTALTNGGGIFAAGDALYLNSTLSGNKAGILGGGLFQNNGEAAMELTTAANNLAVAGAGVYKEGSEPGSLSLQNTLLSNNATGNCDGVLVSLGHNLSSDTNCSAFTQPGDQNNVNPMLGPLANNGGPTLTHLPQPGSPAINAAAPIDDVTEDQRGFPRPIPITGLPDIGSVEVQQP